MALIREEVKVGFRDAVVSSEMTFRLVPKVFDSIDVVSNNRNNLRMIDALVMKLQGVQDVVGPEVGSVEDDFG